MRIDSLEVFLTVAEESNITRAATLLHLSQPTVSRIIMDLEQEINRPLFIRTSKKVFLTKAGLQFMETAKDIVMLYHRAMALNMDEEDIKGDLYIGAAEVSSVSFLAKTVKDFTELYPGIRIHMDSGNAENIREGIEAGILDLGLITRSVSTEQYESLELPGKEQWSILLRDDHPLAKRSRIRVEDLSGEKLIIPENQVFYKELTAWIGSEAHIQATYTLVHNAVHLVKAGMGIMICFYDPSLTEEGLTLIPLIPFREVTPLLIWKQKNVYSPAAQLFLDYIRQK